jgi:hypothetical protein
LEGGALRVFKTKGFARFARSQRISDESLCDAIARAERGLIDANLGGGIIKQRVARRGEGRTQTKIPTGSSRDRQSTSESRRSAKSERENVDDDELVTLRDIAKGWFAADARALAKAMAEGLIQEVTYDQEKKT